ncbi:hypothetical protein Vadar_020294 [Vaccinium darrowii]|uniref:Uncharacterized protein n=1 Tax=Vaccinium darrowii TaxID=229202 RepID=A0ACB7YXZ9_9ERIC|nr:hypothetical protein Vadar_020294 [Vaccinium darrowii]
MVVVVELREAEGVTLKVVRMEMGGSGHRDGGRGEGYASGDGYGAGRELSIWNPSTGKSKGLPNAEMPFHYNSSYGFGYDESVADYKVAGIFLHIQTLEIEVKVYTLRTNLWRRIESFPRCLPLDNSGIYLNGALHWRMSRESNVFIVSLDLANETYGEVLVPDYRDDHLHRSFLDVLNGCLCILCAYDDSADLWVMKEYGIGESWTKLVVIPYATHPFVGSCPQPVCILRNGEVLVNWGYLGLVATCPRLKGKKGNEKENLRFPESSCLYCTIVVYVERRRALSSCYKFGL